VAARFATVAEVRSVLGSAFDDPVVTDVQIQTAIDDLACVMSVTAWANCLSIGSKYAAAHCVAMSPAGQAAQGGGQSGIIASEADGPASRSFAVTAASADDAYWASTWWGRKYLELRKSIRGIGVLILGATGRTRRPF
jgi:hypothetical protein